MQHSTTNIKIVLFECNISFVFHIVEHSRMNQNLKKKTNAIYTRPIFSLYMAGICSQVVLVEFTGFHGFFKQFYFKRY